MYRLNSTAALPEITVGIENQLRTNPPGTLSCDNNTLVFRGLSYPELGMTYDARAQLVIPNSPNTNFCDASSAQLIVPSSTVDSFQLVIAADTSFDDSKGNAENKFSFRGVDPASQVSATVSAAAKKSFDSLLNAHIDDFTSYSGRFTLDLPDTMGSSTKETAPLIASYSLDNGDPYVESLLFDLGRYLFVSSARSNSLPAGLQGRWTEQLDPSWGADFHADINFEMYFCSHSYFLLRLLHCPFAPIALTIIGTIGLSTKPVWEILRRQLLSI
jgi:alpha-L-fucosidase 2